MTIKVDEVVIIYSEKNDTVISIANTSRNIDSVLKAILEIATPEQIQEFLTIDQLGELSKFYQGLKSGI